MPFSVNINDSLGEDNNPITSVVVGSTDDHESVIKTVLLLRPFLFGCHDLLIMTLFLLLNTVVACLCRVPPPPSLSLSRSLALIVLFALTVTILSSSSGRYLCYVRFCIGY